MAKSKQPAAKPQRITKKELRMAIASIFASQPKTPLNYKQLAAALGVKDDPTRRLINDVLREMEADGRLVEPSTGKYRLAADANRATGLLLMNADGTATVRLPDGTEVSIPQHNLNRALHGDTVEIDIRRRRHRQAPDTTEGDVLQVIERTQREFVGCIYFDPDAIRVSPEGKNLPYEVEIDPKSINGAKHGQKVIFRVDDWPERSQSPQGHVVEVLGDAGVHEVEMHAILAEFELPYHFPAELDRLADAIEPGITPEECARRRDMRGVPTLTIDPADAKDFDDALSLQTLPNGNIEVGVHIADVTHYVQPSTPIDDEAAQRATSVYLVDRCVPMLPERLSNFVCSLRPDEDKLCFSVVYELNSKAEVLNKWIGRTVIRSNRRFAYEEAQQVIETGQGDMLHEIMTMHQLAQQLRTQRFKQGAIAFERVEVKFHLDEHGHPVGVYFKESKEANQLIEEFMLLANRTVAEFVGRELSRKRELPFVYRIHDRPNQEKLDSFRTFIARFGYQLEGATPRKIGQSMNKVIAQTRGKAEHNLIETLALRAMAKARYTINNIGHYGLAFDYYTHFTSPIRRYPDMMVHRLLSQYLDGQTTANAEAIEAQCTYATSQEIRAADAERASIKYKQVEFLADKHGQQFLGTISGVTNFGLFVELVDSQCEGLVALRDLTDDYYLFDEDSYSLVGERTGRTFQLGQNLMVEVYRTNLDRKQIDFRIVDMPQNGSRNQGRMQFYNPPDKQMHKKSKTSAKSSKPKAKTSKGKKK